MLLLQHKVKHLTKPMSPANIAACFHRDLREGLKQASKAAEEHHTEQPGPDQHQLQSDVSQQDWVPAITLSVSPRQSQQSGQGVIAADNSKLIGLPLLRATSPPQMLSRSAAADRITVSVPQLEASFSGRQDSDMPLAEADFSKAQDMTCALDCRGHQLHVDQGEQVNNMMCTFSVCALSHMFTTTVECSCCC